MFDFFSTIVKLIALSVIALFVLVLGVWALILILTVATLGVLAWFADMRFTVVQNGETVGYYKRSTGYVSLNKDPQ